VPGIRVRGESDYERCVLKNPSFVAFEDEADTVDLVRVRRHCALLYLVANVSSVA
jgi:hypothetical protein